MGTEKGRDSEEQGPLLNSRWCLLALVLFIALEFVANYATGVYLGQRGILFYPPYRTKVTLAVALSMLRDPPTQHYMAYDSILRSLASHDITDPATDADVPRVEAAFNNRSLVDRAIRDALEVPIDPTKESEAIHANDVVFSDYLHFSFLLFGATGTALYDFYFFLLFISLTAFVFEFRERPFALFLGSTYLALHLWLVCYSADLGPLIPGPKLSSVANSRGFSGLALLPAFHLIFMMCVETKLSVRSIVTAAVQSFLLGFLLLCRLDVIWEILAVLLLGGVLAARIFVREELAIRFRPARAMLVWPAVCLLIVVIASAQRQEFVMGSAHSKTAGVHLVWHVVLAGLLLPNRALLEEYTGLRGAEAKNILNDDRLPCVAILHTFHREQQSDGRMPRLCDDYIDLTNGIAERFEPLERKLAFQIVYHHPVTVALGLVAKYLDQWRDYREHDAFSPRCLVPGLLLILVGAAIFVMSAPERIWRREEVARASVVVPIIMLAALAPPSAWPSPLSVGTFMVYFGLAVFATLWGLWVFLRNRAARRFIGMKQ